MKVLVEGCGTHHIPTAEVNHGELLTETSGGHENADHHGVEVASHKDVQAHALKRKDVSDGTTGSFFSRPAGHQSDQPTWPPI